MDVIRINAAARDEFADGDRDCASTLVERLIRNESASVSVELDIASEDLEKRDNSLGLYYALTQGMIRSADAIHRESGLRSLWLAYPFLLARDINDPENRRSILAPLYLWPIQIHSSFKKQGELIICRDNQAGPPVFNRVLARWARVNLNVEIPQVELDANDDGQLELSEINAAVRSTLGGFPSIQFADLASNLSPLPLKKEAEVLQQPALLNTAALGLFVSENQALIENLEKLQQFEHVNETLDTILANRQVESVPVHLPAERDRYLVTDSDPYQELAIWESRKSPGSIVHGPPGTGKSQTIVNIVADCLARQERVLVVCQKRAAIDVVSERLRAVGLDELCLIVHDSESDRRQIFSDLKEQIASLREYVPTGFAQERARLAEEIDRRELELEQYHKALHLPRATGFSYRQLIGKATSLYNADSSLRSDPRLEELFSTIGRADLDRTEEQLQELAHLWEASLPRTNPWVHRVQDFALTRPIHDQITNQINGCISLANDVEKFINANGLGVAFGGDPSAFISDASEWNEWVEILTRSSQLQRCSALLRGCTADGSTYLNDALQQFEALSAIADRVIRIPPDPKLQRLIHARSEGQLQAIIQACDVLKKRYVRGWWTVLTSSHRAACRVWKSFDIDSTLRSNISSLESVRAQCVRQQERSQVAAGLSRLGLAPDHLATDSSIVNTIRVNTIACRDAIKLITAAQNNSSIEALRAAIEKCDPTAVASWVRTINVAIARAKVMAALLQAMRELERWLTSEHVAELFSMCQRGTSISPDLQTLALSLNRLPQLCAFDAARSGSPELAKNVLSVLDSASTESDSAVWNRWKAILHYSAYTVWANSCLKETPILQSLPPELYERNRKSLAAAISKKRALEVESIKDTWFRSQYALHSLRPSPLIALGKQLVTRGPNSKRLRQVVSAGSEAGIFTLRPCWMTNPNTACQIFQLNPGLFDVVIFDEASQCPLEQAVPILYRGNRAVVAGDAKQLPPTSFFLSVAPLDDDGTIVEDVEETSEDQLQRDLIRDVMVTPDLLAACESVLRNSYLDMHYRSEDPLLIQFSNKAFYGGRLQCPPSVNSGSAEVPIAVLATNGIYERQTNETEARAVVQLLRRLWFEQSFEGTVGVVTFNLKQEDLIQNLLQTEALQDERFRIKYETESDRKDGRQDVSFFVKNLESVQGDERDVMIFSTTFGRDQSGQFKRFFGPLNKEGGERRLNVAVTRAKKKIFVLTSLPIAQISDIFGATGSRTGPNRVTGRDYLQAYMRYAEAVSASDHKSRDAIEKQLEELAKMAGFSSPKEPGNLDFDSEFEISVFEALTKCGLQIDQQVGDSGFRIDLAVRNPVRPESYVLGIECDGRTYHSQFTARARDIWRQQILESRGWKIHRIWSTNWWMDPETEISKIVSRVKHIGGILPITNSVSTE
ncbi:MAG TPA: AAA domain-containing protein [Terriglobales bacterium]